MTVALLPLLWAGGVVPSLLDLLLWSLEQAMAGTAVAFENGGHGGSFRWFLWLFKGIFYDFYGYLEGYSIISMVISRDIL